MPPKPVQSWLPSEPEKTPGKAPESGRPDFYCLRFRVRYSSFDCAVRTKFRTCEGCRRCDQGRFNLRRHDQALRGQRFPRLLSGIGG